MSTKPSAMREYTPPTATPVMMSWSMKTICSFIDKLGRSPPHSRRPCSLAGTHGDARIGPVQVVDQVLVFRQDRRAADLLGPRQLVVVGVQLLVEQGEASD